MPTGPVVAEVVGALDLVQGRRDECSRTTRPAFWPGLRVVQAGRNDGVVKMTTLRLGEPDIGARVHIAPGESPTFEARALVLEFDYVDSLQTPTASGYVELTPVLAVWFAGGPHDTARVRYLLAAARRLDVANRRMIEIEECRAALAVPSPPAPKAREVAFQLIGAVESAVIALGRALAELEAAYERLGFPDYEGWASPGGPTVRWFTGDDVLLREDHRTRLWGCTPAPPRPWTTSDGRFPETGSSNEASRVSRQSAM